MSLMMRRNLMAGGGMPTAKDYVQDGLVGLWDVLENPGGKSTTIDNIMGGSASLICSENDGIEFLFRNWRNNNITDLNLSCAEYSLECVSRKVSATSESYANVYLIAGGESSGLSCAAQGANGIIGYSVCDRTQRGTLEISFDVLASRSHTFSLVYNGVASFFVNGTKAANDYAFDMTTRTATSLRTRDDRPFYARCIRLYSKKLNAEELARNLSIDKARFNLP